VCRRAPVVDRDSSDDRTSVRDLYAHAKWERCQSQSWKRRCNFRSAPVTLLTAVKLRFATRGGRSLETALRACWAGYGARCVFWYVDVGACRVTSMACLLEPPSWLAYGWRVAQARVQQRCNTDREVRAASRVARRRERCCGGGRRRAGVPRLQLSSAAASDVTSRRCPAASKS
jgi:hypothetical protein